MKILGFDCETSGVDLNFTSRPFYLSIANDKDVTAWSWKIDPLTRNLTVPEGDIAEIAAYLDTADILVAHHAKFDIRALHTAGLEWRWWDKTHDTLFSGHLLASGERHDLTTQCLRFLNYDIQPFENDLDTICQEARRIARRDYPNWRIATKGNKDMPSADEQLWKWDMWLPAAVAEAEGWAADHPWRTVLAKYNHIDSSVLIPLWKKHQALMGERKLTPLYNERLKLIRIIYEMEERGVTYNFTKMDQLHAQFQAESQEDEQVCLALAAGELDALPKGGRSKALEKLLFETWKLPVNKVSKKTQTPSMDKEVLGKWAATLPEGSVSHQFITRLHSKRQRDTAAAYIAGYKRYSTKASIGMRRLHPSINPTGTATLRFSSQNPNSQNCCFDGETELLTKDGWVRSDQLKDNTEIAQYWVSSGKIDFALAKVHRPHFQGDMLHIKTHDYIDMLLTPNHRCLVKTRKGEPREFRAEEFKNDYIHLNAGMFVGGVESLTEAEVAFICAVQADGSYHRATNSVGKTYDCGIRFIFSKERKIKRITWILDTLGITYTKAPAANGKISFYVAAQDPWNSRVRSLMPRKTFGKWLLNLDRPTLDLFCKEVFNWDGCFAKQICFTSSEQENASWVQTIFSLSGTRAYTRIASPKGISKKDHHWVNSTAGQDCSMTTNFKVEKVPWNDTVYCVSVPSTFVLIRRNGRVSVTGNSKQGYANLRRAFGPAYGLEWWACDYENIELRIPAYEADETEMVALFERPNDPPYFGSVHFLMFDTLHPELYAKHGIEVKKLFADTWYQWTKNGDFAAQYQSGDETADRAYHVPGALRRIKSRFSKIDELNQRCVKFANKHGYIETLIDREFGVGYPLQVERQWGRAKPTLPLNYRVQGCLAGDSRVLTDKGLIPIRETVGQKVKVWTGFKWAEAVGLDRGKCRRAVVTLDSGLKVRCDTRHKLKNEMDEWVDFEKIKVGNYVALPRNPDPLSPSKEINWWFILGFIIGDGSLCRRGNRRTLTISGWVTKKPILEAIKLFLDKNAHQGDAYGRQGFGLTRFRTRRVGRLYEVSLENAKFADLLEGFGINFDWRFNTKRVPESVWRASLQDQRDFLEGLWLSDGSRSVKRGSGHQLNMVNPKLLQEVQILCSALGFDAHFTGSQLRFRWRGFGAKSSRDYPSNAVLRQVKSVERSKYPEKNESITDQRAFKQALSGKPISQYVAERILERNARNPVIYRYDRITSIEVLDTEESTYTMSVDDPLHQFVADGVVHKNTAMWCMCRAMIRCQAYLADLSGCAMVLQVHDELVFQLPKGETPQANLPTVLKLKELMECSGQDIGIPLPVKCSYHPNNWAESVPYSTTVGF